MKELKPMKMNLLVCGTIAIAVAVLAGCGSTQKTVAAFEPNRELSLQHYLEGSLLDQKEEFARAILEYQEALAYDHDPAIYFALAKDYSLLGKLPLAVQMGKEAVSKLEELELLDELECEESEPER